MKTTLFSKNRNEKNYELFFESDELHRVQYLLETKQFGELSELQSSEDEDTGIKLKLSLAERGKLVTAQLFEYIMSAYEAVSPIMTFRNKEAVALSGKSRTRLLFIISLKLTEDNPYTEFHSNSRSRVEITELFSFYCFIGFKQKPFSDKIHECAYRGHERNKICHGHTTPHACNPPETR